MDKPRQRRLRVNKQLNNTGFQKKFRVKKKYQIQPFGSKTLQ